MYVELALSDAASVAVLYIEPSMRMYRQQADSSLNFKVLAFRGGGCPALAGRRLAGVLDDALGR